MEPLKQQIYTHRVSLASWLSTVLFRYRRYVYNRSVRWDNEELQLSKVAVLLPVMICPPISRYHLRHQ